MKKFLFLILCFTAAVCCKSEEKVDPSGDEYTKVQNGQTVPEGHITDTTGALTYSTMQRDNAVVLYLFWSGCPHCKTQTQQLLSLTDAQGRIEGVKLVCVARGGDASATLKLAREYWASVKSQTPHLNAMPPLYYDDNRAFYALFAIQGVPRIYFIRRDGTLAHQTAGAVDAGHISRAINDSLL